MKWVKKEDFQRIPVKSWCDDVDEGALQQAMNLSCHPVLFRHVALMPDCHKGYGMPIGGVIAVQNAVIPNAVGVDIGCGMCAVRTDFPAADMNNERIKRIMGPVRQTIPLGFNKHKKPQASELWDAAPAVGVVWQELENVKHQLGTLGGGNHFIEIQKGDDGFVWLMLHSGSRNFGKQVAQKYHRTALELCEKWHSALPDPQLAFMPVDTREAQEYIDAMNYALAFALENRRTMMLRVKEAAADALGCNFEEEINIHHNYAAIENHFGKNVWIHRKGATSAREGQPGIIPGSMGTPSYIVKGLGNPESFQSCSHGAGRKMGRKQASRSLNVEECDKAMENVVFGRWSKGRDGKPDLGEAPQAYKDIDEVIEAQLDLIVPVVKLLPLGVIKG